MRPVRRSVLGGRRPRPRDRGALLPPGHPELWVGGRSDQVIAAAARSADAWKRLGDGGRAIRRGGARAPPRGRGPDRVADLGRDSPRRQDAADLERLRAERRARACRWMSGGDGPAFRAFADRLRDMDCSWIVVLRRRRRSDRGRGRGPRAVNSGALKRETADPADGARGARRPRRVSATSGERIAGRVGELPEIRDVRVVMLFSSFGSEVPTAPLIDLLRERGSWWRPRIEEGELVPVAYTPGDPVRAASSAPSSRPVRTDSSRHRSTWWGFPASRSTGSGAVSATGAATTTDSSEDSRVPGRHRVRPAGDRGPAPSREVRSPRPGDRDGAGDDPTRLEQPFNLVIRGAHG